MPELPCKICAIGWKVAACALHQPRCSAVSLTDQVLPELCCSAVNYTACMTEARSTLRARPMI
eukprot:1142695-Pelagomonas_calceolata.AAC.3